MLGGRFRAARPLGRPRARAAATSASGGGRSRRRREEDADDSSSRRPRPRRRHSASAPRSSQPMSSPPRRASPTSASRTCASAVGAMMTPPWTRSRAAGGFGASSGAAKKVDGSCGGRVARRRRRAAPPHAPRGAPHREGATRACMRSRISACARSLRRSRAPVMCDFESPYAGAVSFDEMSRSILCSCRCRSPSSDAGEAFRSRLLLAREALRPHVGLVCVHVGVCAVVLVWARRGGCGECCRPSSTGKSAASRRDLAEARFLAHDLALSLPSTRPRKIPSVHASASPEDGSSAPPGQRGTAQVAMMPWLTSSSTTSASRRRRAFSRQSVSIHPLTPK